jgi:hypothetical protein
MPNSHTGQQPAGVTGPQGVLVCRRQSVHRMGVPDRGGPPRQPDVTDIALATSSATAPMVSSMGSSGRGAGKAEIWSVAASGNPTRHADVCRTAVEDAGPPPARDDANFVATTTWSRRPLMARPPSLV